MTSTVSVPVTSPPRRAHRSRADRRMRALLRVHDDAPGVTPASAEGAFSRSILISASRCLLTYVVLPLLGPIVNFSGSVGPLLGLLLGAISVVAIIASMRRFFAADHRFRWKYAAIGSAVLVLLAVQAAVDVRDLLS
jgi:hypothetical protein